MSVLGDVRGEQAEQLLGHGVLFAGQAHGVTDGHGHGVGPFAKAHAGLGETDGDGTLVLRAPLAADQVVRLQALEEGERVLDSSWSAVPRSRTETAYPASRSHSTSMTRYCG